MLEFSSKSLITFTLLVILFCLITPTNSFDIKKYNEDRHRYASQLSIISNNKMTHGYTPKLGYYCVANSWIKEQEHLFDIPKSMTISPYYIFPFKFEIMDILLEYPQLKQTIGKDNTVASYLLTFQTMIYLYAPKRTMKKYIQENNYSDYANYFEPDQAVFESFPHFVPSLINYSEEDIDVLLRMKLNFSKLHEISKVHEFVVGKLKEKKWGTDILFAVMDSKKYQEVSALINSRTMTVHLRTFYQLEGFDLKDLKKSTLTKATTLEKKNDQRNRVLAQAGMPTIVNFIDICNHGQPKTVKDKNKNYIHLDSKKGSFIHRASSFWRPGEEIVFNYSQEPHSINLMLNYGFVLKRNIFDSFDIVVKDNSATLDVEKISLCREIGCFMTDIKEENKIKERIEKIDYNTLNKGLMNYARVRILTGKIDNKKISQKLKKDGFLTKSNEIAAMLYYFEVIKENIRNDASNFMETLSEGTRIKGLMRYHGKFSDPENIILWKKACLRNSIYEFSFVIRSILIVQANTIIDKIIAVNDNSVQSLKQKYLLKVE